MTAITCQTLATIVRDGSAAVDCCQRAGADRIRLLREVHHLPAGEVIACLYRAVLEFGRGVPQQDDLTAVVIKKLGLKGE